MAGVGLESQPAGVARIVLDRPPLNVIDLALARELEEAASAVRARADVAVVLLEARGRAFSAGVDVRDHLPDRGAEMLRAFHRACQALHALEAPVVCAVHAAALGGGCELTLVCDLVLASDRATFGQPEIRLGVLAPLASVVLPSRITPVIAADMLLTGRTLAASEALGAGLVSRVFSEGAFEAGVDAYLTEFVALSPAALRAAKRAMRMGRGAIDFAAVEAAEKLYLETRLHAPDAIEGLRAFMEKRAPRLK